MSNRASAGWLAPRRLALGRLANASSLTTSLSDTPVEVFADPTRLKFTHFVVTGAPSPVGGKDVRILPGSGSNVARVAVAQETTRVIPGLDMAGLRLRTTEVGVSDVNVAAFYWTP